MASDRDIRSWIQRELDRREWTAADLARHMGVGTGRLSEWMTGRRRPSPESCLRLADALNADPDDVLALAGHRPAMGPLTADDPKRRIISLVRRVRMTPQQAAGLEAMLTAWLEAERAERGTNGG